MRRHTEQQLIEIFNISVEEARGLFYYGMWFEKRGRSGTKNAGKLLRKSMEEKIIEAIDEQPMIKWICRVPILRRRIAKGNKIIRKLKQELNHFTSVRLRAKKHEKWLPDMYINKIQAQLRLVEKRKFLLLKQLKHLLAENKARENNEPLPEPEYTPIDIERIKEQYVPSDIIGYNPVKKHQGAESYICPIHNNGKEKTPSFSWSVDKKLYHCFGCGIGGDIIDLYMRINNCSFIEAIKRLN